MNPAVMFNPVRPFSFLSFAIPASSTKDRSRALRVQQALESLNSDPGREVNRSLEYTPFGMASVLDSVAPPSAQLVGESIRVHDDFFGDVNVKLLSLCPDLTSLTFRCFYLPHTYLPHRRDRVFQ